LIWRRASEAFAIPTEEAMKIALRIQQVIAHESNAANVIDPLGGSYRVEHLTTQMERAVFDVIEEVDSRGGTIKLIEVARGDDENIAPVTIELVRAGASMGDVVERLKMFWGAYRETPVFL
jgi:methylmalonyl-CoA mutase N-terminal domain/subunit